MLLFSLLALLPPMLEGLLGYPVVTTGLVTTMTLVAIPLLLLLRKPVRRPEAELQVHVD